MRRTLLPFDCPANPKQGSKHLLCFRRRPLAHAATVNTSFSSGISSSWSSRSASTRRANACAFEIAWLRVSPYTMTPGSSGISAIHRPSSSLSTSIFIKALYHIALLRVSYPRPCPTESSAGGGRLFPPIRCSALLAGHLVVQCFWSYISTVRPGDGSTLYPRFLEKRRIA
jgi:hypothetical protein